MSQQEQQWRSVCTTNDLIHDSGVCVLLNEDTDNEQQVALFSVGDNKVFAISNYDPFGKANVLYRGIVGQLQGRYVVASPLYKQHFDLKNGECLEDESASINVYDVRVQGKTVEILC